MQLRPRIFTSLIPSSQRNSSIIPLVSKSARCHSSSNGSNAIGDAAAARSVLAKVVLKKGKTQIFHDGNPMVYSGAVDRIVGRPPPKTGDIVVVTDGSERPIAWGMYNSVSMFCVRLMQMEDEASREPLYILNMEKLLHSRINAATDLRRQLGLPRPDTNAYRLVNSEGDRLSGLIVDVFGSLAVIASSAAWVEKYRSVIELFVREIPEITDVKWRPSAQMLKEEGLNSEDVKDWGLTDVESRVKVMENGINYMVSLEGQKIGFYTDQRENQLLLGSLSKGQDTSHLLSGWNHSS